jgi:GNAT superfamily N-acetyltransferase
VAFAGFLNAIRQESRPERFAAVIRAGRDRTQLAHAFALSADEVEQMVDRLHEPYKRDAWRRRAIAFRANAALPGGEGVDLHEDVTVEHVLPASWNREWEIHGWSKPIADRACETLGNFVLLPQFKNNGVGTRLYKFKREVYFDGEDMHIFALTEHLRPYQTWTPSDIARRTEALIEVLRNDWAV